MQRLVALDLPGGEGFVNALRRIHDAGDAVLPVDQRLPDPAKARLFAAFAPSAVVDEDGETAIAGGVPVEEGDAFVVATSGTTGEPKGVVLTHDAVAASAAATNGFLGVDPTRDRWLCCLPLSHVGGLSVLTRSLASRTPVEVQARFSPAEVTAAAGRGATLVSLVPAALAALGDDARRFRTILLGGAAMPRQRPHNTVATYGMTETGSGVVYEGRPLDGVDVEVDSAGEVRLRGPMLLRCYRFGEDPKDPEGWLATGDAGRLLSDGRLEVFGHIGEVIRSGGESVYPAPVESVLRCHPGVSDVAVVGAPDPHWGERVVAFIETDGDDAPTLEELRELVSSELGSVYAPRSLVVVAALPRTAIGKVRRDELRREAAGAER